jgi:natural product biosynthesis luciferase-like monooxygenase protein
MKFGLMFFAASDNSSGADKYRLVLESARFADRNGFASVWTAERHFTRFGGLYPNPAVLHAALATVTSSIRLHAGSVVAPLHHPLRIAEEWSVVDNLSNGRVGVSFASGWNPDDFVFFPERYGDRHDRLFDTMRQVQQLWRGESFDGTNGVGKPARVRMFPQPVQAELPVWVTAAGNPRTFERAGASGANLLTHLLDQDEATLASKIALYRSARAAAGFDPATGVVSLMVHTFVGTDAASVREQARGPYCNYIKANIGLFKGLEASRGRDVDLSKISDADLDEFVNFLYDRFAASRGLIGTPESCAPLVSRLEAAGVNELACLLDFGPADDLILANLPNLARLQDLCGGAARGAPRAAPEAAEDVSLPLADAGLRVHPAALDACARVLASAASASASTPVPFGAAGYRVTRFDALDLSGPVSGPVRVHAVVTRAAGVAESAGMTEVTGDVDVFDPSGRRVARIEGLQLAPAQTATAAPASADEWLYERSWRALADIGDRPRRDDRLDGRWKIVADAGGIATELVRRIEARGGSVAAGDDDLRGVIYLRGLDVTADQNATTAVIDAGVKRALHDALGLAAAGHSTPMWIVTRGAVSAPAAGSATEVCQAPLWGLGRALAVERPGALAALVDLDRVSSPAQAADDLVTLLAGDRAEDMVAVRSGVAYVPRLTRISAAAPPPTPLRFGEADTILVTGGTGGLGLRVIDWLASHGARHIVTCSRRAPGADADAKLRALRDAGIDVEACAVDVADIVSLEACIERSAAVRPAISSVFHLAGVLDDGLLGTQTWDRFARVCASKISGAWNLHRLTRGTPLRHFVMFSSVSSILPAPGQSAYAAANAFLDALAHERRAEGLPALAVNWGPFSDAGHAETDYGRQAHAHLASLGIGAIAPEHGLNLVERLLADGRPQVAVARVDWAQLRRTDPMAARLGLVADLMPRVARPTEGAPRPPSALVIALAQMPADERRPHLLRYLSDAVVAALKLTTREPIDPKSRLFDVGLDSIVALELKDRLERAIGVPLSATLLFVYPTLDALCDYLLGEIVSQLPAAPQPAAATRAGELSEEELTRLLMQEIEASRGT